MRSPFRGVMRGNVRGLALVSFMNDTASEMVYPLLPTFLVRTLGAGAAFLGVIEGVAESTASLLKLFSGWWSDRVRRRKPMVVWGYGLASLTRPAVALVTQPWHLLALRFTDRIGKGVRTAPRDALLADSVPAALRGTAFGLHRAADHAGSVLGPLLASLILWVMPGALRTVFLAAAIPALLVVLASVFMVREPTAHPSARIGAHKRHAASSTVTVPPGPFGGFLLLVGLFTLGNASDAFLLLRAQDLGVPVTSIPLLWGMFHVSKMLANVVGGVLADRARPPLLIGFGWILYAMVYVGFAFAQQAAHVWALLIIYGGYYGLTEAPEKKIIADLVPAEKRGGAFGAYHCATGIAALPASVMFGLVWTAVSPQGAFLLGSGIAGVSAIGLGVWGVAIRGRRARPTP